MPKKVLKGTAGVHLLPLLALLIALFPSVSPAQQTVDWNIYPLDTIVSTNADTGYFYNWYGDATSKTWCGPVTLWAQTTELSDSLDLRIYWEASYDSASGFKTIDSTNFTQSLTGAGGTQFILDTLLGSLDTRAVIYRYRAVGLTSNDKVSGVTLRVQAVAKRCVK